jgi:hypothetical protein
MTDQAPREGDRVEAVSWWLDEGRRIWPVDPANNVWRVMSIVEQEAIEIYRGTSGDCARRCPHATFSVNDNETVPPGTQGTVLSVNRFQVAVEWDNGSVLHLTDKDVAVVITTTV